MNPPRLFLSHVVFTFLSLSYATGSTGLPRCARIFSINAPLDDDTRNFGVRADNKAAFLSENPEIFRLRSADVDGEKTVVSLESVSSPGYFLRQKNYNFRLEKNTEDSAFCK